MSPKSEYFEKQLSANKIKSSSRLSNYSNDPILEKRIRRPYMTLNDFNSITEYDNLFEPENLRWNSVDNSIYADTFFQVERFLEIYSVKNADILDRIIKNPYSIDFFIRFSRYLRRFFASDKYFIEEVRDYEDERIRYLSIKIQACNLNIDLNTEKLYILEAILDKLSMEFFNTRAKDLSIDLEYI